MVRAINLLFKSKLHARYHNVLYLIEIKIKNQIEPGIHEQMQGFSGGIFLRQYGENKREQIFFPLILIPCLLKSFSYTGCILLDTVCAKNRKNIRVKKGSGSP